jgi:guanylate kinase
MSAREGLLVVVSAPSGAGKTSLVAALLAHDPRLRVSISHTTRARRGKERHGHDYYFVDPSHFEQMVEDGAFLEHAVVFGNRYGTSHEAVQREIESGHDVILEIDWQGAAQIRARFDDAISIFILPPSRATLIERLRKRGQDDDAVIAERTRKAVEEMSHHREFDYLVVNDDFATAVADLAAVIRGERLKTPRQAADHAALLADLLDAPIS